MRSGRAAATFGEVMCTTYKKFGAKGLITTGGGRDLAQVDALGFPTFTLQAKLDNTQTLRQTSYAGYAQEELRVRGGLPRRAGQ